MKLVFFARTFRKHALELGNAVPAEPIYFLKAPSAIIGPGDEIRLPPDSSEVHHEAEVAVVIGARLRRASPERAAAAIQAWTVLNDVTARDVQRADGGRFTRAKGYDTFCPLSDVRLPSLDWAHARIQCRVDGALRQDGALADLSHPPAELLSQVSHVMTLEPGDIVSFGTPAGVGPIRSGETIEVTLLEHGEVRATLTNRVETAYEQTTVEGLPAVIRED